MIIPSEWKTDAGWYESPWYATSFTWTMSPHPLDSLVDALTRLCVEVGLLERELEACRELA